MDDNPTETRLTRNEKLIRDHNTSVGKGIKRYFHNKKEVKNAPIAFVCECSMLDCNEHVTLSIEQYEQLHKRRDRFVIAPGHAMEAVEKIIKHEPGFDLVEKFALKA